MSKVVRKKLRPKKWLVWLSMAALILAAFSAEGAGSLNDLIVPVLIVAFFGPFVVADLRHE